tara:strand:- start:4436 stop:4549 length:114 start_codon:yes stop_codon:yes gene_type:complete
MKKKCDRCKKELKGEMLFYPKLCLDCVIDLTTIGKIK